jgi:16S rRNA (adenine1518-N6/adenine1519-N6)-dimethyltransferase
MAWERLPASWLLAGNLPYNVGTALLERVLAAAPPGVRCGFLLQREVVDRLVARPGTKEYGALSVLVTARAAVRRLGTLKPGAFMPSPRVESSFVGVELRPAPLSAAGMAALERVVRAAFGQRRKTLRNALGAVFGRERGEALLAAAGLSAAERAERLAPESFFLLAEILASSER